MNAHRLDLEDAAAAFAEQVIAASLPSALEALIAQAGRQCADVPAALALLEQARASAPQHPVPLIALYRFHFYGHRLDAARQIGFDAMAIARHALGPDFGDHAPSDEAARGDAAVRFYLFTLKGLAYLDMRLGELDEARLKLRELQRLDPQDHVDGALLWQVLQRHALGEVAVPYERPQDATVRGWKGGLP